MFWGKIAPFPEQILREGCYLEPSIDIGPSMTTKSLTQNGQVLCRSWHTQLTTDKLSFIPNVNENLGSCIFTMDSRDIVLDDTPQYDPYVNHTQNKHTFFQLQDEEDIPMPEVADNFLCAEILLPWEDQMTRGHVVAWKRDTDWYCMERACTNL